MELPDLPEGWEWADENSPIDSGLICPCGNTIEIDGECPYGHKSPIFDLI
jgi:hypothetical protein